MQFVVKENIGLVLCQIIQRAVQILTRLADYFNYNAVFSCNPCKIGSTLKHYFLGEQIHSIRVDPH